MSRIATIAVTSAIAFAELSLSLAGAQASQGPGVNSGTASSTLQLAMAVIVYGGATFLVAAGLIGSARQRRVES